LVNLTLTKNAKGRRNLRNEKPLRNKREKKRRTRPQGTGNKEDLREGKRNFNNGRHISLSEPIEGRGRGMNFK